MPGFASFDQIINALSNGQTWNTEWTKNQPSLAVANEFHAYTRSAGNPPADALFNTGTNLLFQAVKDTTTSAGAMPNGGNVQPSYYKYLLNATAFTAAATVAPGTVVLIDIVGFYRVTTVTTTSAQATTNTLGQSDTFTADAGTDVCTWTSTANIPSNILRGTRVRLTTTTTLPAGLATATDYYVIKTSDTDFQLATSYANAVLGTAINITDAGTGTHTVTWLLPRYTNGAGLQAIFWATTGTMGAGTPNLSLGYTNSVQTAGRATPTVLPVGKTAATVGHILYTGATASGKYNFTVPQQSGDAGIAEVNTIQNSTSYVSNEYSVALIKVLTKLPIQSLGYQVDRNFINELPSLPRIYDGAALYVLYGSGGATPAASTINGNVGFVWN
jgi:hypothetical protein